MSKPEDLLWRTARGEYLRIGDMTDDHLCKALRHVFSMTVVKKAMHVAAMANGRYPYKGGTPTPKEIVAARNKDWRDYYTLPQADHEHTFTKAHKSATINALKAMEEVCQKRGLDWRNKGELKTLLEVIAEHVDIEMKFEFKGSTRKNVERANRSINI